MATKNSQRRMPNVSLDLPSSLPQHPTTVLLEISLVPLSFSLTIKPWGLLLLTISVSKPHQGDDMSVLIKVDWSQPK